MRIWWRQTTWVVLVPITTHIPSFINVVHTELSIFDLLAISQSEQICIWGIEYAHLVTTDHVGSTCAPTTHIPSSTKIGHCVLIRLKKKYFVSKLARIFQTNAACGFFIFNWPLPPRTCETKNDWKVSTSVFSEIKRDFTRFLSSHVLKFFQNSKLFSFFVVKMKKKIISRNKKMKVRILQNQMRTEKQMRAAALKHRIFFFSLREQRFTFWCWRETYISTYICT